MKLLLFVLVSIFATSVAQKRVVCYWGTWAVYRSGNAAFTVNNINPSICTHIIYSFFGANIDGTWKSLDAWVDIDGYNYISKFMQLKSQNPSVKLMASIGGYTFSNGATSQIFSTIASTPALRTAFANSVLSLLTTYGFDGFDLDWEYPTIADKSNFVALLTQLKSTLSAKQKLLTIAVGATENQAASAYDIRNIVPQVDFINLMTYDLHGSFDHATGINSPLNAGTKDTNLQLNVDACVKYWQSQGASNDKLVVGIPLYGNSFTLSSATNNGIGAPASDGRAGSFIAQSSFLPYNEICSNVLFNGWTRVFETTQKVPYAYKDDQWVGYDDVQSLNTKLDYIVANNLGGAMFWSIETDDFGNLCGGGKFPMVSLAYNRLIANSVTLSTVPATTTKASIVVTTTKTTAATTKATTKSSGVFTCSANGLFANPTSCTAFYQCSNGVVYSMSCSFGLVFNKNIQACDWPANFVC